jgi:hypothetical protein
MSHAKRKQVDPLEKSIEAALSPGCFISYFARKDLWPGSRISSPAHLKKLSLLFWNVQRHVGQENRRVAESGFKEQVRERKSSWSQDRQPKRPKLNGRDAFRPCSPASG